MDNELTNPQAELLVVGAFYNEPTLYLTYNNSIVPKCDFSDKACEFFWHLFSDYYTSYSEEFTELKLNTFASMVPERFKTYRNYGGYKTIKQFMEISDPTDFKNYFNTLKKYSLLRGFSKAGYDVSRIIAHKSFQSLTPNDICRLVRGKIDKVANRVQAIDEPSVLTENASSYMKKYLSAPSKGVDGPWPYMQKYYRGLLPGNVLMSGALSNSGKGRNLVYLLAYLTLVQNQKILLLANEMSEEAIKLNFLCTCINSPEIQKLHGVVGIHKPERELALGSYKDDNGKYIYRKMSASGQFLETEEEYIKRVEANSTEYNLIMDIMKWVENAQKGKFMFKNIGTCYEDSVLELEIKKAKTIYNCDGIAYDTLKCSGIEDFAKLAATGTKITEWIHDTNLYCICTFQLTDSAWDIPIENLNSQEIASSKRLMHVTDLMQMWKHLTYEDKMSHVVMPIQSDLNWGEQIEQELDLEKNYVGLKIVKNRLGEKNQIICLEVDMNENTWREIGVLHKRNRG